MLHEWYYYQNLVTCVLVHQLFRRLLRIIGCFLFCMLTLFLFISISMTSNQAMDKSWMKIIHRTKDKRYKLGVDEFLKFAYRNKEDSSKIPCPCKKCNNFRMLDKVMVFRHLMQWWITLEYDRWIYHGEPYSDLSNDE